MSRTGQFIVATPGRSVCDDHARVLQMVDHLRFIALATRRGTQGVSRKHTRLHVGLGLAIYLAAITRSTFHGESFRFARHPQFDQWVRGMMQPGDNVISSYGYVNECFRFAQETGGLTFLDGGNSHPASFWEILVEEHRRWKCPVPPVAYHHFERSMMMMEHVDYLLSPSSFVADSFLSRGFRPDQILPNVYPVNLTHFFPDSQPRPKDRPLTLICTGSLSLRKGTPYLLEAYRIIRKKIPNARLLLTRAIADSVQPVFDQSTDLPIEWAPPLNHPALAARLRGADIFILPSLEDGFARTVTEALACGLPVILTKNTGACDVIRDGENGSIVPIRDPQAIADSTLEWWDKIQQRPDCLANDLLDLEVFSFSTFANTFIEQMRTVGAFRAGVEPDSQPRARSLSRCLSKRPNARFIVATPARPPQEIYAVALARKGLLRRHFHGARTRSRDIPPELITNNPLFGGLGFITGKFFSRFRGESLRFGLNPFFDAWVRSQLQPGDIAVSSYGYLCDSFAWLKKNGGVNILDAGNSHPNQFWKLIEEEHHKWQCPLPPISRQQHERGLRSVEHADYAIGVSQHVVDTLIAQGFPADRTIAINRPVNLGVFRPSPLPRPKERPLTIISTGSLSLRKGSPYLLEAVEQLHRNHPNMRLFLTDAVEESVKPLMARFRNLPIDWAPVIPQHLLAARLREADVFVLPSIEEGLARTILEALSCGLPCIVTPNTGAAGFVMPGQNGEVIPICDSQAIVDSVEKWWTKIQDGYRCETTGIHSLLTYKNFEEKLFTFLRNMGLIEAF